MPTDLKAVVQTLGLAFGTDPVTEWNFPRDMFVGSRPEFRKQGAAVEILRTLGQALIEAWTGVGAEASSAHRLVLWQRFGLRPNEPEIRLPAHWPSLYPVWVGPGEWHIDDPPSKGA